MAHDTRLYEPDQVQYGGQPTLVRHGAQEWGAQKLRHTLLLQNTNKRPKHLASTWQSNGVQRSLSVGLSVCQSNSLSVSQCVSKSVCHLLVCMLAEPSYDPNPLPSGTTGVWRAPAVTRHVKVVLLPDNLFIHAEVVRSMNAVPSNDPPFIP